MTETSIFPKYLSPSQVSSLGTCGEQYRLNRVLHAPERPTWGGIGGSAVHKMTEDADRALLKGEPFEGTWEQYWQAELDDTKGQHPEFDPSEYYVSGRASKAWPNKETPEWWAENGPKMVASWAKWLVASGLEIWEFPDAETGELTPAIELEVMAEHPTEELYVRSIIDRVLYKPVTGELLIVDLKSGSFTAAWPQQMALNNLGFKQSVASPSQEGAVFAGFWKGRDGGVPKWFDLTIYQDEWLWGQVRSAKAIRDQQLFIAQPNNLCMNACGVRQHCVAVGGTPFFKTDATLTQTGESK